MKPRSRTRRWRVRRCLLAGVSGLLLVLGSGCASRTILVNDGQPVRIGPGGAWGRVGAWDGTQWVYGDRKVLIPEGTLCLQIGDAELMGTERP